MKYYFFSLLIPLVCGLKAGTLDQRVTVVEYKDVYFGFLTNGGQLYSTTSPDSNQWGQWLVILINDSHYSKGLGHCECVGLGMTGLTT